MTPMSRWLALAIVVGACGHPVAPPQHEPTRVASAPADAAPALPPLDRDLPRLATRALELYTAVAAAFATTGEDCAAATAQLAKLATVYADVVDANARVLHAGRAHELRDALAPHQDAFDAAAQAIVKSATLAKCSTDHAFEDTFDRLVGSPP